MRWSPIDLVITILLLMKQTVGVIRTVFWFCQSNTGFHGVRCNGDEHTGKIIFPCSHVPLVLRQLARSPQWLKYMVATYTFGVRILLLDNFWVIPYIFHDIDRNQPIHRVCQMGLWFTLFVCFTKGNWLMHWLATRKVQVSYTTNGNSSNFEFFGWWMIPVPLNGIHFLGWFRMGFG